MMSPKLPLPEMTRIDYLEFEIQYASIALLWYDWILLVPMEVHYIWGSKIRLSTLIYIFCRYALLANILYLLAISEVFKGSLSCNSWYKLIGALSVLGRAAIIYSFIARSYAVWGRKRVIFLYLTVLGVICVGLDIAHVPGLRCVGSSTIPLVNDLLSILMVIFEVSAAILVSVRCIQTFREHSRSPNSQRRRGFWVITFEQGVLYFSFMSIFTTASVILNFRAAAGFYQRLLNALTLPLSGLLTARFILHLRKTEDDLSALGRISIATTQSGILSTIIDPDFGCDPMTEFDSGLAMIDRGEGGSRGRNHRSDMEDPSLAEASENTD